MTLFASLEGHRVTRMEVTMPFSGIWQADAWLDEPVDLSGAVVLVLGGLTLRGTVYRGRSYQGAAPYRIVGGAGGWRGEIPAKSYQHDAGVKLSVVLGDAAREAGETVVLGAGVDVAIGDAFVRQVGPASRVLAQLVGPSWWVDTAGVTQVGTRASAIVGSQYDVIDYDAANGRAELATETPESILPGSVVSVGGQPLTIATVFHRLDAGSLRTEVWQRPETGADQDRVMRGMRALVREMVPTLTFLGTYEYRAAAQSGALLDLQPVGSVVGLPSLLRVAPRAGLAGGRSTLTLGCSVLVSFVDGDPKRPYVCGFSPESDAAFAPIDTHLDVVTALVFAGGSAEVSRVGDAGAVGTLTFAALVPPDPPGMSVTYTPPGVGVPQVIKITGAALVPQPQAPLFVPIFTLGNIQTEGAAKVFA